MGLARQDRVAATCAGVGSPATSLQQRGCPQPPCAHGVPGGAGPSAALTLLGDDPVSPVVASPGSRPRGARNAAPGFPGQSPEQRHVERSRPNDNAASRPLSPVLSDSSRPVV